MSITNIFSRFLLKIFLEFHMEWYLDTKWFKCATTWHEMEQKNVVYCACYAYMRLSPGVIATSLSLWPLYKHSLSLPPIYLPQVSSCTPLALLTHVLCVLFLLHFNSRSPGYFLGFFMPPSCRMLIHVFLLASFPFAWSHFKASFDSSL